MQSKQDMAKDPVCGMDIERSKGITAQHGGQSYEFCSESCKAKFQASPSAYAQGTPSPAGAPRERQAGGPSGQPGGSQSTQTGQNPRGGMGTERGAPAGRTADRLGQTNPSHREIDEQAEAEGHS